MKKILRTALSVILCLAMLSVALLSFGCADAENLLHGLDDVIEQTAEEYLGVDTDELEDWLESAVETETAAEEPEAVLESGTESVSGEKATVRVSNVEELLAAIAPNTTVLLKKGTYDLTTAESYGKVINSAFFRWDEVYDGYQLTVFGVEGLTLIGEDDDDVKIITTPRYAQVISFSDCTDLVIKDITFGHTPDGQCAGNVLEFLTCNGATVSGCNLYGCGVWGVSIDSSANVTVTDTDIYHCSDGAVTGYGVSGLTVSDCEIYECGSTDTPCGVLITLVECDGVQITETEFENNVSEGLLLGEACQSVTVSRCEVKDSTFNGALVSATDTVFVMDKTEYENVTAGSFAQGDAPVDTAGVALETPAGVTFADSATVESSYDIPVEDWEDPDDPEDFPTRTVSVRTADEFLEALCEDTVIRLEADIDLTTADSYGKVVNSAFFRWDEVYDGYELVIYNIEDLSILSEDSHIIYTVPRYANVLTFEDSDDILLDGVTLGHTEDPGECSGGVLCLTGCEEVEIVGCRLYGCGTVGIDASLCEDIKVISTEIYDCSYCAVSFINVREASFLQNDIHDCGTPHILLEGCKKIRWNGTALTQSQYNIENGTPAEITA